MQQGIRDIIDSQRIFFNSGATRDLKFRKQKLHSLLKVILKREDDILQALHKDLKKHPFEAFGSEITTLQMELKHVLRNLDEWAQPETVDTPLVHWPAKSRILREPLGLVLIFSPWNYPFLLSLAPVVSAVAAGNCCVVKPSEFSEHTSALVADLVREVFEPCHVTVIQGEGSVLGPQLLEQPLFNHVFFTGSPAVGREVMQLAAKHLIPVTLELGGKSPAIVEADAYISQAARRIVWGKFWNAGQTCIAPDYVLVHKSRYDEFVKEAQRFIQLFYGADPLKSNSYGRIIHSRHLRKVASYIAEGELLSGGKVEEADLYIEPTLIKVNGFDKEVMKNEIFGPVLPVLTFENSDEVFSAVAKNPNPLALYVFTSKKSLKNQYLTNIRFGGGGINMPLLHFVTVDMPLEGIGTSGTGNYHGRYSFETFSHRKSIIISPNFPDVRLKYPPFPALKGLIGWLIRKL
ncbi:MAG: aldehyde dehydrogenase family protein [Bacteroidia bacterium]